jgi:hypothetical protein
MDSSKIVKAHQFNLSESELDNIPHYGGRGTTELSELLTTLQGVKSIILFKLYSRIPIINPSII